MDNDLRKDLKDLERNDLEDVVKVQQHVVQVTMGVEPFEHPGAPHQRTGSQYLPNGIEKEFTTSSKNTLYSNFFKVAFLGAFTPFITLKFLSLAQKKVIPHNRYVFWSVFGGTLGGTYGLTLGRIAVARDYLRLENSPLATEARYQLWKLNPKHPFLRGFENETVEWSEYLYHDSRDTDHDEKYDNSLYDKYRGSGSKKTRRRQYGQHQDDRDNEFNPNESYNDDYKRREHDDHDRYNKTRREHKDKLDDRDMDINRNRNRYKGGGGDRERMDNNDNDELRRKKRSQFYANKNKLNNTGTHYSDEYDEISKTFGDHSNPKEDVSSFFDHDNEQKWD